MSLVEDYVRQIEKKETDIVFLRKEIDKAILSAQKEMRDVIAGLDARLDEKKITEKEYLEQVRAEKVTILERIKGKLDALVANIEEMSDKRAAVAQANEDKIGALRKKMDLP